MGYNRIQSRVWWGTEPGTSISTANPGTTPKVNGVSLPTYIRYFDGAFFYFLQNIVNVKHQLLVKFDCYDPDTKVSGSEIGMTGTNLTPADIKFSTLGFGYVYYFSNMLKLILYNDFVKNEETQLPGYTSDLKDNILTLRLQFRF